MRIKAKKLGPGLHPSEIVLEIETRMGIDAVIVDEFSFEDDSLSIGWPVGQDGDYYLVELPRPAMSGSWRVWVRKSDVKPDRMPERRRA